ncbi:MAG: DUF5695 domain-containing protein [Bacteroidota bacterium]|nr:DUF5695 domain-containing protein [Bacteroidota bacterium]
MKIRSIVRPVVVIMMAAATVVPLKTEAQRRGERRDRTPVLNLEKGTSEYETANFRLGVLNSTQTVAFLRTNDAEAFDFTPGDRLHERSSNGFYHLGDLNIGLRTGDGLWEYYSTARKRSDIEFLNPGKPEILSVADLSRTLPDSIPLKVTRYWEKDGDNIAMRFTLTNTSAEPVEIGALGMPMVFNNNFNGKSLDQAHAESVFFDPYIGMDAGYLQVAHLHGKGKVLVAVPFGKTPFEAWRPLTDDPLPSGYTYEGLHEWMVHSKSYAETAWKEAEQWNNPTSVVLKPGETVSYGVRFILAGSLRDIENTLAAAERPVAVGIPGYVVPTDVNAKLFLRYGKAVRDMKVEPEGALEINDMGINAKGWKSYDLKGKKWGRARLTVTYEDGLIQTVNYKVIEPESEVVASYGNFLTTEQWFDEENDPFGRAPSVITYDYEKREQVRQDRRVWVAGLSDEAGAGSWLGAIMKQLVMPDPEEVKKMEDFVNQTLWGGIQYSEGDLKYGVKKSLFYYEPQSMPEGTYDKEIRWAPDGNFPSWNTKETNSVGRSYNYPHVAAAHWVMYRLARNYSGLVTQQEWQWYLENAFHTSMAMIKLAPHYAQFGQMEGTVFILILNDLKAEGMAEMAADLEAAMKGRVDVWMKLAYPFGSEMPWDSTGQEEVYMWAKYFGLDDKALVTLNAILAYMPTVPHWAYNGNARRFWDFLFAGKLSRFERMIHHYGSALNSIPVLHSYRENPSDLYLLRVGYGGVLGAISNITQDGFAPAAFHSFPQTLKNDGITGDYGTGFLGYAINSSTYLVNSDEFGWLSFGGNTSVKGKWVTVDLTTAARSRVYIAPAGVWLTLDAGRFSSVSYNTATGALKMTIEKGETWSPEALLRVSNPSRESNTVTYNTGGLKSNGRGAFVIPVSKKEAVVILKKKA